MPHLEPPPLPVDTELTLPSRRETSVAVERVRTGAREARLTLRCAGKAIEFGDVLSRERRVELARRLRQLTAIS